MNSSSPGRTPTLQLAAEQLSTGECWIQPKKIPHVQGQRRSPSKTVQFSSVQLLSCVQLLMAPQTAAHQASLSITNSQSSLKLMSIELVMPSNHLILCHPLLLPPSIFPSIRVFSNESVCIRWPKYLSFSFNISPSNKHPALISFRMDWWKIGRAHV